MEKHGLGKELHKEPWLVQLETGTRRRVIHWVRSCVIELNGMETVSQFNVLQLAGYGSLLGMD